MKDIEKVVADNIKRLLKEKKISQTELAKIAEVSESTVGKWVLEKAHKDGKITEEQKKEYVLDFVDNYYR